MGYVHSIRVMYIAYMKIYMLLTTFTYKVAPYWMHISGRQQLYRVQAAEYGVDYMVNIVLDEAADQIYLPICLCFLE
jgi:hypothetical protein